jgi:Tfp pilus assembly protein FimT
VLAILALLTAAAMPAVAGWGEERALDLAARSVALDMRRLQQAAITSGLTCCMQFYLSNHSYRMLDYAADTIKRIYLPEGITIQSVTFLSSGGTYNLCFRRSGAPNRGGTLCIRNERGDRRYVIVTPATGRVRISKTPPEHWEVN